MVSFVHGVVALIHTYTDAPLVGKGCAVIGKASVQSGPQQTGQEGSKQCRYQRLSRAVALDIAHPCGEHTRTSHTRVENTPGDNAHPCEEHTRRVSTSHHRPSVSVSTMVSVLGSCFCLSALFCKVIYYCFIVSVETELYRENTKSPTHVENTPGHRPPVWRTHQESEHVSP